MFACLRATMRASLFGPAEDCSRPRTIHHRNAGRFIPAGFIFFFDFFWYIFIFLSHPSLISYNNNSQHITNASATMFKTCSQTARRENRSRIILRPLTGGYRWKKNNKLIYIYYNIIYRAIYVNRFRTLNATAVMMLRENNNIIL